MSNPIQCTLAENAIDYLLLAGEQTLAGKPRLLKHALATLADGIELLLKARLELHDWCLLFKDVDKAERSKFESGDFQSVTVDQAIGRLKNICGICFDHSSFPVLTSLRQYRNRIRHFSVTVETAQAHSVLAAAYSFSIDFIAEEITPKSTENLEDDIAELRKLLGTFSDFVNKRMRDIQDRMEAQNYSIHIQCPACLQDTMYSDGDVVVCAFCNFSTDAKSAAYMWADENLPQSLSDSVINPIVRGCPECCVEACIPIGRIKESRYSHVCLSCAEPGNYQDCSRCGELCRTDSVGDMCNGCRNHIIRGWD